MDQTEFYEYFKTPKFKVEKAPNTTLCIKGENVSCGDSVEIFLDDQKKVFFCANACSLCVASTSFLLNQLNSGVALPPTEDEYLKLFGFKPSINRVKCMLLGYRACVQLFDKIKNIDKQVF